MDLENISEKITVIIRHECEKIIENIAVDKGLDKDDLIDKYLDCNLNSNFLKVEKKKRMRRNVPSDQMCLGRKMDMSQCTRRRKGDKLFCATHFNNLPFGRIDDSKEYVNQNKSNDYIAMRVYEIDNNSYLIDNNNIIYTYDVENPVRIGIKNEKDEFIKISIEIHDGIEYMVDKNNNVYSVDVDNPELLGFKNSDNKIIFNKSPICIPITT